MRTTIVFIVISIAVLVAASNKTALLRGNYQLSDSESSNGNPRFVGILYETWFNHVNMNGIRPVYPNPVRLTIN